MKSGIKIGIILCIGCLLVSCKPTTIKGKVINPINGKGIEGVSIAAGTGTMELPGGYKTKEKVVSDANGNFVLQYKGEAQISVSVGTNYYPVGWHLNGETVKGITPERGEATHADYYAVPYGKYQSSVHNVNCQGPTDTAYFKWKYILDPDMYGSWSPPRVGCYNYTNPNPVKLPCGKYISIGKIIRSGNISYVYDTVVIKENQVTTLTINY